MQAYYCPVTELTLVAGLTLATGVCLIATCLFKHMQACSCLVAELTLVTSCFDLLEMMALREESNYL